MANVTVPVSSCTASAIPTPTLYGAEILAISATPMLNYTASVSDQYYYNHPSIAVNGVDFCNITVTYTHPGQNDTISVENWLPLSTWNGRLQSVGGGGWVAGRFYLSYVAMAGAIGEGYAASTSDAGLPLNAYTPDTWALTSEGNVNLYLLQDFGSVTLNDQVSTLSFIFIPPSLTIFRQFLLNQSSTTSTVNHLPIPIGLVAHKVAVKA